MTPIGVPKMLIQHHQLIGFTKRQRLQQHERTTVNSEVVAPIPNAMTRMAVAEKPGVRMSVRTP